VQHCSSSRRRAHRRPVLREATNARLVFSMAHFGISLARTPSAFFPFCCFHVCLDHCVHSTWAQSTPSLRTGSGGGPPQFLDRLCTAQSSPYRPRSRQAVLEPRRCPTANNDKELCRNKKELYNTIAVTRTTLARSLFYPHDHSGILLQMCVYLFLSVSCLSLISHQASTN
jgi:hypothetical protein